MEIPGISPKVILRSRFRVARLKGSAFGNAFQKLFECVCDLRALSFGEMLRKPGIERLPGAQSLHHCDLCP